MWNLWGDREVLRSVRQGRKGTGVFFLGGGISGVKGGAFAAALEQTRSIVIEQTLIAGESAGAAAATALVAQSARECVRIFPEYCSQPGFVELSRHKLPIRLRADRVVAIMAGRDHEHHRAFNLEALERSLHRLRIGITSIESGQQHLIAPGSVEEALRALRISMSVPLRNQEHEWWSINSVPTLVTDGAFAQARDFNSLLEEGVDHLLVVASDGIGVLGNALVSVESSQHRLVMWLLLRHLPPAIVKGRMNKYKTLVEQLHATRKKIRVLVVAPEKRFLHAFKQDRGQIEFALARAFHGACALLRGAT